MENEIARKGNAFLKALAESDKYGIGIKGSTAMLELIKQHVSQTLAEDMLYELLSQSFDETPYVILNDCGPKFISCIKQVRTFTGLGLKETKELCDQVRHNNIPQRISFSATLYSRADVMNAFRREGCIVE